MSGVEPPAPMRGRSGAETRRAVLGLIRSAGGVSRADLARRSGLTEATISRIVRTLEDDGLIRPHSLAPSTGGKRPVLYRLNHVSGHAVGVSVDHTSSVVVACTLDGVAVAERHTPLPEVDGPPAGVLDHLAREIDALLGERSIDRASVVGVGLAAAGRKHGPGGWTPGNVTSDRWEAFDAGPYLRRRLGLPVTVENDANCAALGVSWTSPDAGSQLVAVYMAYGLGAGLVLNGRLYRGASGNAGEIGHRTVPGRRGDHRCWCGSSGCLESFASPRGLVWRLESDAALRATLYGPAPAPPGTLYRALMAALGRGDAVALTLVQAAARHLADCVVDLVNTFDLEQVVLVGPGFAPAPHLYLAEAQLAVARSALARGLHPVRVTLGPTGPQVAALGAAAVVLHHDLGSPAP